MKENYYNQLVQENTRLKDELEKANEKISSFVFWDGVYENWTHQDVANELLDYKFLMQQVPAVYSEVTGGIMSKTNYYAQDVIELFKTFRDRDVWEALDEQRESYEKEIAFYENRVKELETPVAKLAEMYMLDGSLPLELEIFDITEAIVKAYAFGGNVDPDKE